jgi:hypothetical protein
LVDELPPEETPIDQGVSAADRFTHTITSQMSSGLTIAGRAVRRLQRSPRLLMVAMALITVHFGGIAFHDWTERRTDSELRNRPIAERATRLPASSGHRSLEGNAAWARRRWISGLKHTPWWDYILVPTSGFMVDLNSQIDPYAWIDSLATLGASKQGREQPDRWYRTWRLPLAFLPIRALLLAVLLGWLAEYARGEEPPESRYHARARYGPLRASDGGWSHLWRDYVRNRYAPLLAFLLIGFALTTMSPYLLLIVWWAGARGDALWETSLWVPYATAVLMMLAPYMIVGRKLGAWGGLKAGVVALWQRGWTLLVLFVIYRVVQEAIFCTQLAGPRARDGYWDSGAVYMWQGMIHLLQGLLGFWLAMALMMLVIKDAPIPATSDTAEPVAA